MNLWNLQGLFVKDKLKLEMHGMELIIDTTVNRLAYLVWRPCSRLVLVVGKNEERQCAELWVLQG